MYLSLRSLHRSLSAAAQGKGEGGGGGDPMAVDGQAGMDGERVWAAGAAGGEASSHGHGLIAIISLQEKTFAQTLCTSPIPKVHIPLSRAYSSVRRVHM